jgi:hypothetical protein
MAYIAGQPLDQLIDPDAPMPTRRAAEIVRGIALALAYAHANGVIHRDLKPANVMMTPSGEPVVMDFGLAKFVGDADAPEEDAPRPIGHVRSQHDANLTRQGGMLGTPSYMSPEQVRGDIAAVGPRSDVYALGAVLFELLTGRPPYTGPLKAILGQILNAPVPPLQSYRMDAPALLAAICQQALSKEPSDRFTGMEDFARALNAFLETAPAALPLKPLYPITVHRPPTPSRQTTVDVELVRVPPPLTAEASLEEETPFEQITAPAPVTNAIRRPGRPVWRSPVLIAAALLALLVMWGTAVALRGEKPNGTFVVEIDDPTVGARAKNGKLILTGPDGKDRYTLAAGERDKTIEAGTYKVRIEDADGLMLDKPEFTLKQGDRVTARLKLEPKAVAKREQKKTNPVPLDLAKQEPDSVVRIPPALPKNESDTGMPSPMAMTKTEPEIGETPSIELTKKEPTKGEQQPMAMAKKDILEKKASLPPPIKKGEEKGFVPLFNGKDLTGWDTEPNLNKYNQNYGTKDVGDWSVKDGVLIARSTSFASLSCQNKDLANFHLKTQFMADGDSGGIMFRFPIGGPSEPGAFWAIIGTTGPRQTGSLVRKKARIIECPQFSLREVAVSPVAANKWGSMDIIAIEDRITIKINRVTVADLDTAPGQRSGSILLFAGIGTFAFKNIEIKELKSSR